MSDNNMDAFNDFASKIFDRLYSEFPKELEILVKDFVDKQDGGDQHAIFSGTMSFLEREGFIVFQNPTHEGIRRIYGGSALTAKGLTILDAIPDSVKGSESFIQKIRTGIAAGGGEAVKAAIQSLIAYGVTLMCR